jgi:hypothetical protein
VTRAGGATRAEYEAKLLQLAADIAEGLPQAGAPGAGAVGADAGAAARKVERAAAWPLLAELAGGLLLCRAVEDETVANEIASAVLDAVLRHAKAPHGARS